MTSSPGPPVGVLCWMAKVDIVTMKTAGPAVLTDESNASLFGVPLYCTRVRAPRVGLRATQRIRARRHAASRIGQAVAVVAALAADGRADPDALGADNVPVTISDPSLSPQQPPAPAAFRPSWDLDGLYVWLGPVGAATWSASPGTGDSAWNSTFGADVAVIRIREREAIGAIGGSIGANRSALHSGRVWCDAVIGTPVLGHMVGASVGPVVDFSNDHHPRLGASMRFWGFVGIAPYARLGVIESNPFIEIGVHIPLPVLRR